MHFLKSGELLSLVLTVARVVADPWGSIKYSLSLFS